MFEKAAGAKEMHVTEPLERWDKFYRDSEHFRKTMTEEEWGAWFDQRSEELRNKDREEKIQHKLAQEKEAEAEKKKERVYKVFAYALVSVFCGWGAVRIWRDYATANPTNRLLMAIVVLLIILVLKETRSG